MAAAVQVRHEIHSNSAANPLNTQVYLTFCWFEGANKDC